jgi:glutathione S-transferase
VATLFSFRRCPYAIRARLALSVSGTELDLVEVSLRDKPARMLEISAKGTVPVVELDDGTVIDESLDIMLWSLRQHDPEGWLGPNEDTLREMIALIEDNDGDFKHHLDRTKYAVRFEGADPEVHRAAAGKFLATLSDRLTVHPYLMGSTPLLADWAVLPFIRQFANIDRTRFDATTQPVLGAWLDRGLASPLFQTVMQKGSRWAQ